MADQPPQPPAAGRDAGPPAGTSPAPPPAAEPAEGAQPTPAADAPAVDSAPDDDAIKDDDHADAQWARRDDVRAGMRALGVQQSGVYITANSAVFHAAVVGGNYAGTAAARPLLEQIARTTISEIDACFVQPDGFGALHAALTERRLIVLRAHRRWGRTTLAIRLLSSTGVEKVHELRTDAPLVDLRSEDIPRGGGVLVDGLSAVQAAELRFMDLQRICDWLIAARSFAVLVVDSTAHLSDPAVGRTVLELTAPPKAREVVLRHLKSALPGRRDDEIQEMIDVPRIAELLLNVPAQAYDVQQLTQLAGDVVELNRGAITLDEVLTRYKLRSNLEIGDWFKDLSEAAVATALAVAALQGMPFESISSAARRLEDAYLDKYGDRAGRRPRQTRTERLNAARTALTTTIQRTRYGSVPTQVAAFLDESLPPLVLDHVWYEYDSDRDLLLDWLRQIAQDPSPSVRTRAAMALGYLACHDFDMIWREVIVGWAASGDHDQRERAVAALAIPARHHRTQQLVLNLVADWAARSNWRLRIAAVRALGTAVGPLVPGGPDAPLAELAKDAGAATAIAIGDSFAELMLDADEQRVTALLDTLLGWSGEPIRDRQQAGAIAFLEVADTLWRSIPRTTDDDSTDIDSAGVDRNDNGSVVGDEVWWPSLLAWADATHGSTAVREKVVGLWGRALVIPKVGVVVARTMRRWAIAAETDARLRDSFADLFADIANTGPRQASIVRYQARSWRGDDGDAPDTGSGLLNLLN